MRDPKGRWDFLVSVIHSIHMAKSSCSVMSSRYFFSYLLFLFNLGCFFFLFIFQGFVCSSLLFLDASNAVSLPGW